LAAPCESPPRNSFWPGGAPRYNSPDSPPYWSRHRPSRFAEGSPMATFPIERFLNIRSATAPTFSPDGRFVAFLSNITGVAQLWQVPAEGGWPVQLTFADDSVRTAHYAPARHEIVYSMDAGGNERTQLYRLRGVGGGSDHAIGDGWEGDDLTRDPKAIH